MSILGSNQSIRRRSQGAQRQRSRCGAAAAAPRAPPAGRPAALQPLSRQRSQLAQLLFSTKGFVSSTLCFFTREAQCFLLKRRVRNKRGKEDITALVFHNAAVCWLEFYFR